MTQKHASESPFWDLYLAKDALDDVANALLSMIVSGGLTLATACHMGFQLHSGLIDLRVAAEKLDISDPDTFRRNDFPMLSHLKLEGLLEYVDRATGQEDFRDRLHAALLDEGCQWFWDVHSGVGRILVSCGGPLNPVLAPPIEPTFDESE